MAEQRVQRRLAAILVADVVGYSRLMEADEEGTRSRLNTLQSELIGPQIAADGGRIVKTTGDGMLAEFPSAVDAVRSALSIQTAIADRNADQPEIQRLVLRIGINVGNIISEHDDIHGDGVNVAARLEALCEPGAVYVSGGVYDLVVGKIDAAFDNLGEQTVKNLSRPVRIFWARPKAGTANWVTDGSEAMPLPAKPSIAVLPFKNLSGDTDQDYLADGLRLAIQASFVHNPGLFLLAPIAVRQYRDQEVDAHLVAREMRVRYVLEGAAQRSGERIRIVVQLTDAIAGQVVWAERYDRDLTDTLAIQDEIALAVVTALDIKLVTGRLWQTHLSTLTSLDALNAYFRGLSDFYARNKNDNVAAKREFEALFGLEPASPIAPAYLAMCHWNDASLGWTETKNQSLMQAVEWAEKAVGYEDTNGFAHIVLACIHLLNRRHDEALAACYRAVDLRPTCPLSNMHLANILHYCGHSAEAVPKAKAAMRIMNIYPSWFLSLLAAAYRDIGDVDQSIVTARQGLALNSKDIESHLILCSDFVSAGLHDQAKGAARDIIEIDPTFSLADYAGTQP